MDTVEIASSNYQRPSRGFRGVLNKGLGPLPEGIPDLRKKDPQLDWDTVPKPRLVTLFAVIGIVIAGVYALWFTVPWSHHSIVSGVLLLTPLSDEATSNILSACILIYLLLIFHMIKGKKKGKDENWPGLLKFAISEELWFRAGCEKWTWTQRVYSCVTFGLIHLMNFIIPLCVALVLIVSGAVLMAVYLREYNRTQSTYAATFASGRFHAGYNETVLFIVLPCVVVVQFIYALVMMF